MFIGPMGAILTVHAAHPLDLTEKLLNLVRIDAHDAHLLSLVRWLLHWKNLGLGRLGKVFNVRSEVFTLPVSIGAILLPYMPYTAHPLHLSS